MNPVLLTIGPFTLYSFGFFLFIGVISGVFVVWKYGRILGFPDEKTLDALVFSIAVGLVFSRIFYCLLNNSFFGLEIGKWVLFLRYPGFSLIGSILGGLAGLILFSLRNKVSIRLLLDIFSAGFILGKFFGDLGSFFAGMDVGVKTTAITATMAAGFDGKRHPVALYDAFFAIIVFIILARFLTKRKTQGMVFVFCIFLYGTYSLILEFVREDVLYLAGIKFGFIGSGLLIFLSLPLFYLFSGRSIFSDLKSLFVRLLGRVFAFKLLLKKLYLNIFRKARILLSRFKKHDKNIE